MLPFPFTCSKFGLDKARAFSPIIELQGNRMIFQTQHVASDMLFFSLEVELLIFLCHVFGSFGLLYRWLVHKERSKIYEFWNIVINFVTGWYHWGTELFLKE